MMEKEFIKKGEDVKKLTNKVLIYDHALAHAMWNRIKSGQKIKDWSSEDIWNQHKLIVNEMEKRGLKVACKGLLIDKLIASNFMPINRGSESIEGDEIKLSDFLNQWNTVLLRKDFVTLVGSLPNWERTKGDVDILIKADPNEKIFKLMKWRIERAFPKLAEEGRLHILSDDYWHGPFTNHISLGDLAIVVPKKFTRVEMSTKMPDFRKLQDQSLKQDTIKLFRPFYQQKPQHGRSVGEAYSWEALIRILNETWPDWKEKGVFLGKKFDGATVQLHHKGSDVKIWSEDGTDVTENLPELVEEVSKKPGDWIVLGEVEYYKDNKHQPRADTAGLINAKEPRPESDEIRISCYDLLYSGKDIHEFPYEARRKGILDLKDSEHFKVSRDEPLVFNEKALLMHGRRLEKLEGSEGVMFKLATEGYELEINPTDPSMIKFKTERQAICRVTGIHKVKGAEAWVYDVAVDEDKVEKVKDES